MNTRRGPVATTAARPRRRRRHLVSITALIVVLALVLSLFGCWNWVNNRLNKSAWLTDKAGESGTSWLIVGSDERDDSGTGGSADEVPGFRTDTMLVLTKPTKGSASLISIPRDSLVKVDGTYMKLNAVAETTKPSGLVAQVEDITGRKIDHVAQIKFNGLQQVVNALGGVKLCYDDTVNDPYSGLNWQAGCHQADGGTALAFSRMRYADPKGDFGRAERQRQVIGAIFSKALSSSTLTKPSKVIKLAEAGLGAVQLDEHTNPLTLASMALAFRAASGDEGITGSVYWTDPDYYPNDALGSTVLLDDARNHELFDQLRQGTHKPGKVGTLAQATQQ